MIARVSHHAIERFQKRWHPELPYWEARAVLKRTLALAKPLREKSIKGDEMCEYNGIRFIIRRDPGYHKPICVTVLEAVSDV